MSFVDRAKFRLQLAIKGHKALGEIYRPILSSIHSAGVRIHVTIDPVLDALELPPDAAKKIHPPTLDRSVRLMPDMYDSDTLTREAIWSILLASKPDIVVETGVANGLSSQTILSGLEANGRGRLYSFDVDPRTEDSVPTELRHRWVFKALTPKTAMKTLSASVLPLAGKVGVWFHDSDHNYSWQRSEFELAARTLGQGGVLISDDADGTEAFADFCLEHPDWASSALFDTRKVCGFARKPLTD